MVHDYVGHGPGPPSPSRSRSGYDEGTVGIVQKGLLLLLSRRPVPSPEPGDLLPEPLLEGLHHLVYVVVVGTPDDSLALVLLEEIAHRIGAKLGDLRHPAVLRLDVAAEYLMEPEHLDHHVMCGDVVHVLKLGCGELLHLLVHPLLHGVHVHVPEHVHLRREVVAVLESNSMRIGSDLLMDVLDVVVALDLLDHPSHDLTVLADQRETSSPLQHWAYGELHHLRVSSLEALEGTEAQDVAVEKLELHVGVERALGSRQPGQDASPVRARLYLVHRELRPLALWALDVGGLVTEGVRGPLLQELDDQLPRPLHAGQCLRVHEEGPRS